MNFYINNNSAPILTISNTGNLGIGTNGPSIPIKELNEWVDIHLLSETNKSVKNALDMLKTTYYLAKQNGNKT